MRILTTAVLLGWASFAQAQFQGDVAVIHSFTGTGSFGWAVSELGDIDDDGVNDFIIGSTGSDGVQVFSGATGVRIHQFTLAGSQLGYAIADAGDVDDDGRPDIIAGGPLGSADGLSGNGVAHVYSGRTGNVIWRFSGEAGADRFGTAVSTAGDVDGDGHADLLIGAEASDAQGFNSGRAYVFSGRTGERLHTLEAEGTSDSFGSGTAVVGDLNDDGIAEHLIGAYTAAGGGRAYVHNGADGERLFTLNPDDGASTFGQFFVGGPGDVNNDGTDDLYVGDFSHNNGAGRAYVFSGADQSVLYRFSGSANEGAGPGRGAGDVDGDGHADLIVGYWTSSLGGFRAGRVTVFSGADGSELERMVHQLSNTDVGFDAVGIGDVNGDGRFDYLLSGASGNVAYVTAGRVDRAAPSFNISPGLAGSWFNPDTSGQGFFLDVFPDEDQGSPASGQVFLAWFTYDTSQPPADAMAVVGDPGHRWITAQGSYTGNVAELTITTTRGGLFDQPEPVQNSTSGSLRMEFSDCDNGMLDYDLPDAGLSGSLTVTRISKDNVALCEVLSQ